VFCYFSTYFAFLGMEAICSRHNCAYSVCDCGNPDKEGDDSKNEPESYSDNGSGMELEDNSQSEKGEELESSEDETNSGMVKQNKGFGGFNSVDGLLEAVTHDIALPQEVAENKEQGIPKWKANLGMAAFSLQGIKNLLDDENQWKECELDGTVKATIKKLIAPKSEQTEGPPLKRGKKMDWRESAEYNPNLPSGTVN